MTNEAKIGDEDGKGYIYCGDKLWVPVGASDLIKRRRVSKRAIAAADRADKAWDRRQEAFSTPAHSGGRPRRGGRGGSLGGTWTGD